jgi:hypothetical protein
MRKSPQRLSNKDSADFPCNSDIAGLASPILIQGDSVFVAALSYLWLGSTIGKVTVKTPFVIGALLRDKCQQVTRSREIADYSER